MKAPRRTSSLDKLLHEVQLARLQLTRAEQERETAKEQARVAKRRRKEAREAARRARKQARLAKRAVTEAKQILAEAERNLSLVAKRAAKPKTRKRPTTRAAVAARRKKTARRPMARSASPPAPPAIKLGRPEQPAPSPAKGVVSGIKPAAEEERKSITVPRDLEVPASSASPTPGDTIT